MNLIDELAKSPGMFERPFDYKGGRISVRMYQAIGLRTTAIEIYDSEYPELEFKIAHWNNLTYAIKLFQEIHDTHDEELDMNVCPGLYFEIQHLSDLPHIIKLLQDIYDTCVDAENKTSVRLNRPNENIS